MTWPAVRLQRIITASGGIWGTEPAEGDVTAPCIRGTDFDYDILRTNHERAPLRGFTRSEFDKRAAQRGDLIVEKSGGGEQQPVGRVVLHDHEVPVVPTNFAGRLRPQPGVDARFISYLMASLYSDGRTTAAIKQTTGIQNLDLEALLSTRVRLPPNVIQRAIADFLDIETSRIDALIGKKRSLVERLLEHRAATTVAGVGGNLTQLSAPRIQSILRWFESHPEGWRTAKLTLVSQLGTGHTPSRTHPEWWLDCAIPWVTTGEVAQMRDDRIEYLTDTRERISELGIANSSATLHPSGTVMLSRTASAGYSAIMGVDMATSQDFVTWTCGPLIEPRFLLLCLRAMRPDLLNRLAQGSTHKTIYMPDVESIRIPLPPIDEQLAIVDETWSRLRSIDEVADRMIRQLALLRERRQVLITATVTGELEIPGAAA